MSPYTVASRRSSGKAAAGYQSAQAARSAADANLALMDIMRRSAQSRRLEALLGLDGGQQVPPGPAGGEGSLRKSTIPDSPGKFTAVKLPKLNPSIAKAARWAGGPGHGLSILLELYQMYAGHRDGLAATRPYMLYGGWSFYQQCTPPPGYNLFCEAVQPNIGVCLSLQALTLGHSCTDTNVGAPGTPLASSAFMQTMGGDGGVGAARRFATLEFYRRNPAGSTIGGRPRILVQPHGARAAKKAIFGPMPNVLPKRGALRARPEAKWFPELMQPGGWHASPMSAPWAWLSARADYNPMRADSEQSSRGYSMPSAVEQSVGQAEAQAQAVAFAGGGGITVTQVGAPTRTPPNRRTKETKLKVSGARAILKAVNLVTEGFDVLDAFYDALPKNCKRTPSQKGLKQMRPQHKLAAVAACWEHLSWKDVVKNLVENEVEDRFFGGIGQGLKKLNRRMGRPVGVQAGGSLGKLPKGSQSGPKPWDNWTDLIWP